MYYGPNIMCDWLHTVLYSGSLHIHIHIHIHTKIISYSGPISDLMQSVRSLIFDNITVIWRDTSPAGICEQKDHYLDHSLFIEYNDIARKALAEEGVLMLDIWNATLPYWDQHLEKKGDQLHYCLLQFESAQNIWIEKLMNLILKIVV